ncbi:MAG: tRNA (guanosine(46)-N7)-methyltransferase TrmB [Anaplasmataceae bacterium]|nr:tRNA (guanosine(46)-N7)-methyltransferase TrmB [Anaplasmataceae bacterium]
MIENHKIRTYGRLKGKGTINSYNNHLDDYTFKIEELPEKDLYLEIGFGTGDFILHKAQCDKDITFIGCEVYQNGINKLINCMRKEDIKNIKIWPNDARDLLENLKNSSIKVAWILFPDPWPKKRHNKRRLINYEFLSLLKTKIAFDGKLFIATDIIDYAESIKESNKNLFIIDENNFENDYIKTSYHNKASTDINYLTLTHNNT